MTILTAIQATDAYKDRNGDQLSPTSSTDYFNKSAGQYATMDRFAFTQKLFGTHERYSDGYVFSTYFNTYDYTEFTNDFTAVLGLFGNSVTIETLLTSTNQTVVDFRDKFDIDPLDFQFGLSQRREMIKKFVDGNVNQSDYVDLVYVYGSSSFSLDRDTIIKLDSGGFSLLGNSSATINGGVVHPYAYPVDDDGVHLPANTFDPENFDFKSQNKGAQVFNAAWAKTIAPDGGDAFDLTFTPEYQTNNTITQYTKTDFENGQKITTQHKAEMTAAIRSYWAENYDNILVKIISEAPELLEEIPEPNKITIPSGILVFATLALTAPKLANDIIAAYVVEEELEKDLMLALDFGNLIHAQLNQFSSQCFPAGTLITLHDGSQKTIENICKPSASKGAGRQTSSCQRATSRGNGDTVLSLDSDQEAWKAAA